MDERVGRTEHPLLDPLSRPKPSAPPRARRRGRLGWLLLLLAAGAIGVALYLHPWSGGGGKPAFNPADAPQPVGVAPAAKGQMPLVINALGTVTPLATVTVRTQIAGQLMEVGFTEGQIVRKGDFLAQVDPRPYQALLAQAQGTLAKDQALLAEARIDLARYSKLQAQDSIARQQVDTQQSLVHQYEGQVITDQAAIDTQKLNLIYCHITAPVTGRVGLRQVDAGNYVQTSDTNGIVVITQLEPISVVFTVPEDALSRIMPRLKAAQDMPVMARDRSDAHLIATGSLTTVDNQIDTTTGTVKIRAGFANADDALFPNQFVNARLLYDTLSDAILVPNAAIQRGAPGTFVYRIKDDGTVGVVPVQIGPDDGRNTVIDKGLDAGDRVVVDGADRLREGAKVTVPADNAHPAAQPAAQPGEGQPSSGDRPHRRRQPSDPQ